MRGSTSQRAVVGLGSFALTLALAWGLGAGCGSSSSALPSHPFTLDSGTVGDAAADSADTAPPPPNLYQRLGGHAGIRTQIDAIIAAEVQDPDIASFFVFQPGAPGDGHPTIDQISECFTDFLGSLPQVGGTETYPTMVSDDAGSFMCRSMMTAHAAFNISGGTFTQFVLIAGESLQAGGVTMADVATLTALLDTTRTQIVGASVADAGEEPFVESDASSDGPDE